MVNCFSLKLNFLKYVKTHTFLEFIVRAISIKVKSRPRLRCFIWRVRDSKLGPPDCRSRALPLSYNVKKAHVDSHSLNHF